MTRRRALEQAKTRESGPHRSGRQQKSSRALSGTEVAAVAVVVALGAVAFATVLRPRDGYASNHRLLVVLALGAGAVLGGLLIAATAAKLRRGGSGSLWLAIGARPNFGVVLALFAAAAVGSQAVPAIRSAAGDGGGGPPAAARADFQRWQEAVVPIVVRWMHAIKEHRTFLHGFPSTPVPQLRHRIDRSSQTLERLAQTLATDSPRLPQRPELRRLTRQLALALAAARRAQRSYVLALTAASQDGAHRTRAQRLVERGNADAERSVAIMAAFSLDANRLGGSLFAEQP